MKFIYYAKYYWLIVFLCNNVYSQFSAFHGIMFPYDTPHRASYSMGGMTYTQPDPSINILNNPISPLFSQGSQFFVGFNQNVMSYQIFDYNIADMVNPLYVKEKGNNNPLLYQAYLGSLAGMVPFRLFKKEIVASISINQVHHPEHEIWITHEHLKFSNGLNYVHHKSGSAWNGTVGFAFNLSNKILFGSSWTQWFGGFKWIDENVLYRGVWISSHGKYRYRGNMFNFGLAVNSHNILLSIIYHSPVKLLEGNGFDLVANYPPGLDYYTTITQSHLIQQQFTGAIKAGLIYKIKEKYFLSAGFRFQRKSTLKDIINCDLLQNEQIKDVYGSSHRFTLGGEYLLNYKKNFIPLFIAYSTNWSPLTPLRPEYFPEDHQLIVPGYQAMTNNKNSRLEKQISFGFRVPFNSFMFHLSGQLLLNSIQIFQRDGSSYLFSSFYYESFEAKKTNFFMNIGVSYMISK